MVESEIETASETPRRKRKQEFLTADRRDIQLKLNF